MSELLRAFLGKTVNEVKVPAIVDRVFSCTSETYGIISLHCRLGGLIILKLSETSGLEFEFSRMVTKDLTDVPVI